MAKYEFLGLDKIPKPGEWEPFDPKIKGWNRTSYATKAFDPMPSEKAPSAPAPEWTAMLDKGQQEGEERRALYDKHATGVLGAVKRLSEYERPEKTGMQRAASALEAAFSPDTQLRRKRLDELKHEALYRQMTHAVNIAEMGLRVAAGYPMTPEEEMSRAYGQVQMQEYSSARAKGFGSPEEMMEYERDQRERDRRWEYTMRDLQWRSYYMQYLSHEATAKGRISGTTGKGADVMASRRDLYGEIRSTWESLGEEIDNLRGDFEIEEVGEEAAGRIEKLEGHRADLLRQMTTLGEYILTAEDIDLDYGKAWNAYDTPPADKMDMMLRLLRDPKLSPSEQRGYWKQFTGEDWPEVPEGLPGGPAGASLPGGPLDGTAAEQVRLPYEKAPDYLGAASQQEFGGEAPPWYKGFGLHRLKGGEVTEPEKQELEYAKEGTWRHIYGALDTPYAGHDTWTEDQLRHASRMGMSEPEFGKTVDTALGRGKFLLPPSRQDTFKTAEGEVDAESYKRISGRDAAQVEPEVDQESRLTMWPFQLEDGSLLKINPLMLSGLFNYNDLPLNVQQADLEHMLINPGRRTTRFGEVPEDVAGLVNQNRTGWSRMLPAERVEAFKEALGEKPFVRSIQPQFAEAQGSYSQSGLVGSLPDELRRMKQFDPGSGFVQRNLEFIANRIQSANKGMSDKEAIRLATEEIMAQANTELFDLERGAESPEGPTTVGTEPGEIKAGDLRRLTLTGQ